MATTPPMVYQFKISLVGMKPPVWRRILVPEKYDFYGLHVAIQDVMPWKNYHLWKFEIINPNTKEKDEIGPRDENMDFMKIICGKHLKISQYFKAPKDKADYVYDFGIEWDHIIVLEKILPAKESQKYPCCIAGKTACPPEDGGPPEDEWNSDDEDYQEDCHSNPKEFDPETVVFDNPEEGWKRAVGI